MNRPKANSKLHKLAFRSCGRIAILPSRLALLLCLLIAAVSPASYADAIEVTQTNLSDVVLSPDDALQFQLNRLPSANEGELRLILGHTDVSGMLQAQRSTEAAEISFDPGLFSLPEGSSEVVLYLVSVAGAWEELGRWTAHVAAQRSFTDSEYTPSLVIGVEGQLDEGHSGDAFKPDPRTYQDVSMQAGWQSRHARDDFEANTSFNLVGNSRQEKALRFGEKQEDANKVDLSDFLLELQKGDTRVRAGHVSYGNNSLLLDSFSTRGVVLSHQITKRVDISLSSMNATSIVGFDNITGLSSGKHRVDAANLGFELMPSRPGALRAELTYMDASKESDLNFDVGEVADAETSEGWGLRLVGSNESGRLRADLSVASSRFQNPNDPFLSFGDEVVETEATKDLARHIELSYAFLQNWKISERISTSFTFSYTHDKADPLYRSLGAYVQADQLSDQFSLSGQVGHVNIAASHLRSEDNLDDVITILKTKTRNTSASANTSLQQLFGSVEEPSLLWPSLNYAYNKSHQFAANDPVSEDSGFNGGSHLPDQMNTSHELGFNWSLQRWDAGLRAAIADQDNRQTGREEADFELLDYTANVGWRPSEALNLGVHWSTGTNEDKEADIKRRTEAYGFNVDWQVNENWSLSGNYDTGKDHDSLGQATSKNDSGSAQVSWSFAIHAFGRKLPGQLFLRYSRQENESKDNLFDFESDAQTWFLNSGLSITLF